MDNTITEMRVIEASLFVFPYMYVYVPGVMYVCAVEENACVMILLVWSI